MTNFDKFKTYCRKFCVQTRLAVRTTVNYSNNFRQRPPRRIIRRKYGSINDAALSQVLKASNAKPLHFLQRHRRNACFRRTSPAATSIRSASRSTQGHRHRPYRITDNRVVLFVGARRRRSGAARFPAKSPTRLGCRWSRDGSGSPALFAAVTDVNGGYTVRVPGSGAEIVYSISATRASSGSSARQTVINLALQESTAEIGAVVVTARRYQARSESLTYNVQQIAGDGHRIVKDVSVVNSLVGKVAGVRINRRRRVPAVRPAWYARR